MERDSKVTTLAVALVAVSGLVMLAAGGWRVLGRLPGDVRIETDRTLIYLPLATGVLASVWLSAVLTVVLRMGRSLGRFRPWGWAGWRLPGDIRIVKGNVQIFFPVTTCLLLSLLLTLLLSLALWLLGR